MIDFIFDFFMEVFPTWLSGTIFGAFFVGVNNRINNKFLKIVIYSTIFILSLAVAFGSAIVVILFATLVLIKLNII